MSESVYVETTIFSFFHDRRPSPAIVAMRDWTIRWWNERQQDYDLATSTAVLAELDAGSLTHRESALSMAMQLPTIPVDDAIQDIVEV